MFTQQAQQLFITKYINIINNKKTNSIVLWHGLGSGKTMTSIYASLNNHGKTILIWAPASLIGNYQSELKKAQTNTSRGGKSNKQKGGMIVKNFLQQLHTKQSMENPLIKY